MNEPMRNIVAWADLAFRWLNASSIEMPTGVAKDRQNHKEADQSRQN